MGKKNVTEKNSPSRVVDEKPEETWPFRTWRGWEDNIKMVLKGEVWRHDVLDSCNSGLGPMADSCVQGSKSSCYKECGKQLN